MTPPVLPLPFEIDERLNATGVVGICRGYCLIGTFEPPLSVDNISSRSICNENIEIVNFIHRNHYFIARQDEN